VSADDLDEPLTPSHLMVGRRILSLPDNLSYYVPDDDENFEVNASVVKKRAKHLNSVLNHFWKRWSKEYLLELLESHRHSSASRKLPDVNIGDVVVVHDGDHPRGFWKLALVERLISGRDGHIEGSHAKITDQEWTVHKPATTVTITVPFGDQALYQAV